MSYQSYTPWTYGKTPKSITVLIILTALICSTSAMLEQLFINVFNLPGPQEILGLSWWGMSHYYFWQPLTCLFVENTYGISFSFLIGLSFSMYMLWLFGSNLVEAYGTGPFLRLYFISGILASLAALMVMPANRPFLLIAGTTPALLAIFVAWAILHRETQLLLFFLIPVKAKWLLAAVIIFAILIPLSSLDFVSLIYYATGIIIGYLYSTLAWRARTPFEFMEKIDDFFIDLGRTVFSKTRRLFSKEKKEDKIVDIKTGQQAKMDDDDAFIDAMLAKISRYGEKSLSWQERDRMQKISEKKMRSNK